MVKAEPMVKAQPIVKTEPPVEPKGPSVMVEEETGTEDIALEDSDTTESITELADSDLKAIDIVAMFPELKEEKDNADKSLADRRDKEGVPLPPAMGPSDFLKALGTEENLSTVAQQVLMTLPPGVNQAVQVMGKNKVIQKRLQNGVNLIPLVSQLEAQSGLRILHPEQNNFWGTTELVATVVRIGQWVLKNVGNIQLDVADLSDHNGGLQVRPGTHIRTHRSHQYGIDVDLGYLIAKNNEAGKMRIPSLKSEDFLMDKQWQLFQVLFREDIAQQIYVSAPVKRGLCLHLKQSDQLNKESNAEYASRIAVVAGHENHFHLRIKCGPDQKLCGPTPKVLPHPCPR